MGKGEQILSQVMADANILFGKIMSHNTMLLGLCNDKNYSPTFENIFDFYISSHSAVFIKNFYFDYIESPGILLNARCLLEGIALKEAYKNKYIDEFNIELLKRQAAIIEYKNYKRFKELMELVNIPEDIKRKYNEAVDFYKSVLVSRSDDEVSEIINSQIPFLCNPKLNYKQIINDNLGKEVADYYAMLSIYIHPRANEPMDSKTLVFILLDIFHIIKGIYDDYPNGVFDLRTLSNMIFVDHDADRLNDVIKNQCKHFDNIKNDFVKNFGSNYVTDTFHSISMLYQEMAFDTVFGFSEQVKSKWKLMIELIAGFYEVYLNNDDIDNSFRLLQYHDDIAIERITEENIDSSLAKAYEHYKKKYPNGVNFEMFSHKFITTAGFTIDEGGKVKNLSQLVNQLCNLFNDKEFIKIKDVLKLNYLEAQMLSHANGYLWYANSGAWGDSVNVYINMNHVLSFICFYMSNIYKDGYEETKAYRDKKTSNVLKQAGKFIRDNTKNIYDILIKKEGHLYEYLNKSSNES